MRRKKRWLRLFTLNLVWLAAVLQVRAESRLYFPRLTNQVGTILGVTFVNPSDAPAQMELTAYDTNGLLLTGPGITNPAQLMVPAQQQVGLLAVDIFGQALPPDTVAWFEATSAIDGVTGFYLFLDTAGTSLDGANLPEPQTRIIFNRVEVNSVDGVSTELNIVNTQPLVATIDLILIDEENASDLDPDNDAFLVHLGNVPGHAVRRLDVGSLFELDKIGPSAYIVALSNTRIVGFEVVREAGRDAIGLNAKSGREKLNRLYFPQLAVLGPFQMKIGVVNRSLKTVTAIFTAFRPDGQPYAAPQVAQNRVVRQIRGEFPFQANVQELFGFVGNEALQGWVLVETTSQALNGYVSYGIPANGSEAAVAALAQPQTEALISHIASTAGFFTGVAALNPAAVAVSFRIVALTAAGQILGSFDGILGPGERISRLIEEYIPEATGQSGGIIWIRSSSPLYLTALFGRTTLQVLSNIPTLQVLDSYRPDSALPGFRVAPDFLVLAPGGSSQFSLLEENGAATPTWMVNPEGSGSVDGSGLFTAPSSALDSPILVQAEDANLDIRAAATVDVLEIGPFDSALAGVTVLTYSPINDRLFAAQAVAAPGGQSVGPQGGASSRIWQITSQGATELTTLAGQIRAMLPFEAFDETEYLLLATADSVIRLNPANLEMRVVADNFFDLRAMVYDSINHNLVVADAAGLAIISGANIEPDRISNLEQNGTGTLRVLNRAGIGDVAFDPCSGDFLFSLPDQGELMRFGLGNATVQRVAEGLPGADRLLLLKRLGQACLQAGHLLVGSVSSNQVSLYQMTDGSTLDWQEVAQPGSMAFLPGDSSIVDTATVVISERGQIGIAGSVFGGLVSVAVSKYYQDDSVNPPNPPQIGIHNDAVGDTFELSGPPIDIVEFTVMVSDTELIISLTLADPLVLCIDPCNPPPASPVDALFGLIDIDLDQNSKTGSASFVDLLSPYTTGMGVEFCIDLGTYDPASQTIWAFSVVDNVREMPFEVPIETTSHTLTIRVPLNLLADAAGVSGYSLGSFSGLVNAAIIAGSPTEPTDAAPNGGSVSSMPIGN